MAWRVYKSTDGSAPVLTGETGSLIKLLDAVLVDGYGAKVPCGWSRNFPDVAAPDTTIVVYRNGSASVAQLYLRVRDNSPGTQGGREAWVRGFRTMTDNVEANGVTPFPTAAQQLNGVRVSKSNTADSTARPWIVYGDARTIILLVNTYLTRWEAHYFGDINSFVAADAYAAVVIGGACDSGAPDGWNDHTFPYHGSRFAGNNYFSSSGTFYAYLMGTHTQAPQSLPLFLLTTTNFIQVPGPSTTNGYGILGKVNPTDGSVYCAKRMVGTDPDILRGWLRGTYAMCHKQEHWTDFETFNGAGELAGKVFDVIGLIPQVTNVGSPVYQRYLSAFENTDTVA